MFQFLIIFFIIQIIRGQRSPLLLRFCLLSILNEKQRFYDIRLTNHLDFDKPRIVQCYLSDWNRAMQAFRLDLLEFLFILLALLAWFAWLIICGSYACLAVASNTKNLPHNYTHFLNLIKLCLLIIHKYLFFDFKLILNIFETTILIRRHIYDVKLALI